MKAVRVNLFGGSSTKQRPDSEPRSLGDHGSVFRFLGSQLEGKILRGPMWGMMVEVAAALNKSMDFDSNNFETIVN